MKLTKESSPLATEVSVSAQVTYMVKESKPENNYFFFSYKIRIQNKSRFAVQLMSRHWHITDSLGQSEEVSGAGVVGLQPTIEPGQSFEYESACPSTTPSCSMKGSYRMIVPSTNETFEVPIHEFYLIAPFALH